MKELFLINKQYIGTWALLLSIGIWAVVAGNYWKFSFIFNIFVMLGGVVLWLILRFIVAGYFESDRYKNLGEKKE